MKRNFLYCFLLLSLLVFFSKADAQQMKRTTKSTTQSADYNPNFKAGVDIGQDPSTEAMTGTWSALATSVNALSRSFCVYAKVSGVEYIYQFGGGNTSAQLRSIARYNIGTNSWAAVGSLNLDVSTGAAINVGDSVIYVFGGSGIITNTLGSTQKFNLITNTTTTMAAMPTAITDAAVVKYHDSLIYVIGGGAGTFGASTVTNVQVYNIKQNSYASATPYPIAAAMMGFGIDGNKIICAGGWNGTISISTSYKGTIDPSNHLNITWSAIPDYPISTLGITRMASYFIQKGAQKGILMTGGSISGSTNTNKTYFFNTVCEQWDSTGVNTLARANYKAAGRGDSVVWCVAGFTTVGVGTTDRYTASSITCAQLTNDVGCLGITSPPLGIALPSPNINPQANVKNFGTATQTFNVTMTISPGGYSSTKTVTGLTATSSQSVNFDPYTPVIGNYTVKVYTQLATDENHSNDTCTQSLVVIQPNYGGGGTGTGGYYFANSTSGADLAPSKPSFCWQDTTGSTSLVVNSVASIPVSNGSLDDGYWVLTGLDATKKVKFMGVSYDSVFIGTNGIICFTAYTPGGGNWYPPAAGLPGPGPNGGVRPGFYPGWNDLDWSNVEAPINNRLSYKVYDDKDMLVITYDRAPLYAGLGGEFEKFQICLELVNVGGAVPNSNIVLNIDSSFNSINLPYLIGLQDGTGANYLQYNFINASGGIISPGPLFDGTAAGLSVEFGPDPSNFGGCCKELNLTAYIEGYWDGVTYKGDTLLVSLRSPVSPYNVIEAHKVKNNSSGLAVIDVGAGNGLQYYISIENRSSIETWTQLVQWSSSKLTYNLTSAASQAYGDNQVFKSGKYVIYSGDVNQDGIVDLTDGLLIDNDAYNFVSGYVPTDVNYDDIVDISDAAIQDNNAYNFVAEILPP